ncbi:5-(carboxyamino)imidazole ribonucleotide synthase [Aliiruegeria sabulilitoris]|uniref:5-(carboxyamino)imidazole ribonucleotide synthase n=1 Tax=Aliiruegeria sabulilitoris TaxID=1510458 RepID=UPI00083051DC|nr:5-(carboxyamino)imidazole ribonucleotide synthase [Aliiruegeria sabulilitoris]NDR59410.1 5-(carboxyamino)imidazole ribonucleotide synthase [Pseudoruegeria sp. M32A2M]
MIEHLPAGATIGILGGGQLGRMLSVAAARLGYKTHIFEPGAAPAADVAAACTHAAYEDTEALEAFARSVDVVTFEFENVPAEALDRIEAIKPLRPNRKALSVSQDRLTEKDFLSGLGLQTAPYANVESLEDLTEALKTIGCPAILKTRRLGYDGKGQVRITVPEQAEEAFDAMKGAPAVLEGFVDFSTEISVIAARGLSGEVSCFDPGQNLHEGGILRRTTVPAPIPARLRTDAVLMAGRILNELDYLGVLGVELFVTSAGLVVNEIAPRVHNSGHWTQNGCAVDQFEQHIRAVTGWPLGDGSRHADVVMENLIGDDMDRVPALAADNAVALHLYGKTETRPGRKMGHANRIGPRSA